MQLQRVVIATDFSAPATDAAIWTARYFAPDAELALVHTIVIPEPPRFLRGRFPSTEPLVETARIGATLKMRELSGLLGAERVRSEIRVGDAAEEIAQVSNEYDSDLVVVGQHGERPGVLGRLGSTAEQVIRTSAVPVLLVVGAPDAPPRRLLVPVDDSDVAPVVIGWARFLTARFQANATAIHVIGPAAFGSLLEMATVGAGANEPEQGALRAEVRDEASQWLTRLVQSDIHREFIETDVAFGELGEEIAAIAQNMDADLIVMGSHGRKGLRRYLIGSVAGHVLRHAHCPTLVVREPEDDIVN
ncbi:MAG TPA: universal stress protein [Gemmatimonadaceae bacterium]